MSFCEDELDERLTDSFEGVAVDVLHVVADGVPRRTEAALRTVGVVVDDVDTGDVGCLIDRHVVVGDVASLLVDEEAAVTGRLGGLSNLLDDAAGVLHGVALAIETSTLATHHVEQDGVAVVGAAAVGSPILSP